jgi:hypothetical protein
LFPFLAPLDDIHFLTQQNTTTTTTAASSADGLPIWDTHRSSFFLLLPHLLPFEINPFIFSLLLLLLLLLTIPLHTLLGVPAAND